MSDSNSNSLFDQLGGRETLKRVHRIFYDKIYADSWIGQFFRHVDQTTIENQQTDFMTQAMGGPQVYFGAFPIPAHQHMNITTELFEFRHRLLKESLDEAGVPSSLAERWLKIDGSFRTGIVKKSIDDCKKRFFTDDIQDFEKPWNHP
jgi:hemoglobin